MAFVIGMAPDALLSIEYQDMRRISNWSRAFRKIIKVKYNCKLNEHSKISVFNTFYSAKCAADEIIECVNNISFRDASTVGFMSICKKPEIEKLKIFEIKFEEVQGVRNFYK